MSRLVEKLDQLDEWGSTPLGFGASPPRTHTPCMLLLARISAGELHNIQDLVAAGVDAIISSENGKTKGKADKDAVWGLSIETATPDEMARLKEKGYDFVCFGPSHMPIGSLGGDGLGRVLLVDTQIPEEHRQTIDLLPVDVVFVVPDAQDTITVTNLMSIISTAGITGKPVLLLHNNPTSKEEVENLHRAGISGIVVDVSKANLAELKTVRHAIDSVPRRNRRHERRSALVPQINPSNQSPHTHEEDEEQEEGE